MSNADREQGLTLRAVPSVSERQSRFPRTVPAAIPPLVGRRRELERAAAILSSRDERLLTLTGTGGVGKSRLAVELAVTWSPPTAESVLYVPLAGVADPALVLKSILRAAKSEDEDRDPADAVADLFGDDDGLLVVDNFEQLLDAATQLAELLARCPRLRMLVTSRRALRLPDEHELVVGPLPAPARRPHSVRALAANESVALLVQTIHRFDPDFRLDVDNAEAVATICRRLDGLPLAIELAGSRLRVLSPAEMVGLLESPLELLRGGRAELPPHQRAVRATVAWSYDMLASSDQDRLLASAVFAGGFGVDALAAVSDGDVFAMLDSLGELVDHHLLHTVAGPVAHRRFDMLDTIREFAMSELKRRGSEDALRSAHADWCLSTAESLAGTLTGANPADSLDVLDREHDNLRAALSWLAARDADERGLRLSVALWRFWWIRGHQTEGRVWLRRVLAAARDDASPAVAAALHAAGELAEAQGDYPDALQNFERSCSIREVLDDAIGIAECWNSIGLIARELGDFTRAAELHVRALDVLRRLGNERGVAISLNSLAAVAYFRGDLAEATSRWNEAVEVVRSIGDHRSLGLLLGNVGAAQLAAGRAELAVAAHEESVAIARELGDVAGLARALGNLGEALVERDDLDAAADALDDSLRLLRELGDRPVEAMVLHTKGKLAVRSGDVATATREVLAALEIFTEVGPSVGVAGALELLGAIAVRSGLIAEAVPLLAAAAERRQVEGSSPVGADDQLVAHARSVAESQLGTHGFSSAWNSGASWSSDRVLRETEALLIQVKAATALATADAENAARRFGLTVREVEIVSRLLTRSTDNEIATDLFVSPRTVATHVSSILHKLGVSSRRDVATAIDALGLRAAVTAAASPIRSRDG